jgi:ABC-2 type transport system ATP-binding protein
MSVRPFDRQRARGAIGMNAGWGRRESGCGHAVIVWSRWFGPLTLRGPERRGLSCHGRVSSLDAHVTLVIDGLHKRFGDVVALDGIGFRVAPGEVFGFLGANGAGKTTTMRIVLNILAADEGTVTWRGVPNTDLPRRTWGYLPEERGLYARMEILEQLLFFAGLYGVDRVQARRDALGWLERFRIPDYAARKAEELSKGNQQKIQFIAAILHDPDVLVMDEPFSGLDPVNAALLKEAFVEMRDRGKTDTVEELCESIAIVDRGRIVVGGPIADVKRASGRRVVRLAIDGDPGKAWAAELSGVRVIRNGLDFTELELTAGRDPDDILRAALERGQRITRFEIADPSLEAVFIEHVGRPPAEEQHLALPETGGQDASRAVGPEFGPEASEPDSRGAAR